jgi:hypothetical protein
VERSRGDSGEALLAKDDLIVIADLSQEDVTFGCADAAADFRRQPDLAVAAQREDALVFAI